MIPWLEVVLLDLISLLARLCICAFSYSLAVECQEPRKVHSRAPLAVASPPNEVLKRYLVRLEFSFSVAVYSGSLLQSKLPQVHTCHMSHASNVCTNAHSVHMTLLQLFFRLTGSTQPSGAFFSVPLSSSEAARRGCSRSRGLRGW